MRASDFITSLIGGLDLEQNQERLKTKLSGQLEQFCYWDYNELDALDYSVSGSLNYRATERIGLSASAQYAKDSQRDRDTETTGMLVTGDRKSADLSLGSDYMISELSRVEVTVGLGDSETQEVDSTEDNNTIDVSLAFRRDLSEYFKNTVGLFNLMYMHYAGEQETYRDSGLLKRTVSQDYASDVYQFSTGFSHNISELYSLFCVAGASYTKTSEQQGVDLSYNGVSVLSQSGTEYDSDTWGGIFSSGIDYKDEYWTMGLSLSQDVRGGTGTSGTVQRTSLSGSVNRKLTSDLSLTFRASAYLNKNEREIADDTDTLTFNIQPGFRYQFQRGFVLSGAWRFTTVEDREHDTNRARNLVFISLKKEFDLKDF